MFQLRYYILIVIGFGALVSCANRGTPSGGPLDLEPPIIEKVVPENFSTNFNSDEIRIYFNEYVKIKDLQKQLIVSPPLDNPPTVLPLGGASKYISIKLKDTLKPNTTYAFNFGESIVDNNEENPYPYYRYVFSTGDVIDSLSVKGYVEDAVLKEPDTFISVMLYEVDSTYTDSIVYKEKPRYITNTLDSLTSFEIENIKEGTYKLIALKDKSNNYKYDQKYDKIGFVEAVIEVPQDSMMYGLKLFKEALNYKAIKPKQESGSKIIFPYEGNYEAIKIQVLGNKPEGFNRRITKNPDTDTLYFWYSPKFEADTTFFTVTNGVEIDTFKHRFRNLDRDSLSLSSISSTNLNFDQDFTLEATTPIVNIDPSKMVLINKDSVEIAFDVELDSVLNRTKFQFEKEEGQKYYLKVMPESFMDFFNDTNRDTLDYTFRTKMKSEYGNIRVRLKNAKFPLIVQLVDKQGVVQYEKYTIESPLVDFNDVVPKLYDLRAIFDSNANGKYDPGNFLLAKQPERVSYSPPIDEVRANFDQIIEFILLD